MNLLIADSGSTKSDWRFLSNSAPVSVQTEGFNPYLLSGEEILQRLTIDLKPKLGNHFPEEIFFYGAGCGTEEKKAIVREALEKTFRAVKVTVESDLLGAARSLCGREPGIAAILGTGSNSCAWDGEKIVANRPSLGYILGDEGGGSVLGKELVRLYLYGDMEEKLRINFEKRFDVQKDAILNHVYREPMPNRFLASFSKFIFQNLDHQQCVDLVAINFRQFFRNHILRYDGFENAQLHVTGSVGFYFSNILRRISEEQGIRLGRITETPIAGLVNYHLGV